MRMRTILMAAMATCAIGAAQAVTLEWDKTWEAGYTSTGTKGPAESGNNYRGFENAINLKTTSGFFLSVEFSLNAFTASDYNGYPAIFSLTSSSVSPNNNDNNNLRVSIVNGNNGGQLILNGNAVSGSNPQRMAGTNLNGSGTYKVNLSLDAGKATVELFQQTEGTWSSIGKINEFTLAGDETYEVDKLILGTGSMSEGNTYRTFGNGVLTVSSVYVLPEPTALALLALGVAGLALRRRVA